MKKKFKAWLWSRCFYFQFWCRKKAMASGPRFYKVYYFMDDLLKNIASWVEKL